MIGLTKGTGIISVCFLGSFTIFITAFQERLRWSFFARLSYIFVVVFAAVLSVFVGTLQMLLID